MMKLYRLMVMMLLLIPITYPVIAQLPFKSTAGTKKISTDLFGLFFEDINYAADGGLYAELIQNRSFEYSPTDNRQWHSLSFWEYITPGFSYGSLNVETSSPLHVNNPHYVVLTAEHIGMVPPQTGNGNQQPLPAAITSGRAGVGIKNPGFGNIITKTGEQFNFSFHARLMNEEPVELSISLQDTKGRILSEMKMKVDEKSWKPYNGSLRVTEGSDSTQFVLTAVSKGKLALDMVSLFPAHTYKNRPNGLRADLARLLAEMNPAFIRFPGGCLAHGDGVGNMYRWKNTIGPLEQRTSQKNIWGYHQTAGLGYYEYFQFCEDIGAKPLPVLPAGVSCQNSGGTWRIGGTGQQSIPIEAMKEYVQEVLDLVEWANGPVTSTWGAKRAAAGHPAPFNLQYIGIGNEDKITPEFEERFKMIFEAVKAKYPEIILIGTSGPFHSGEDFEKGWKLVESLKVPVVDEHYYVQPEWLISNQYRYDQYDRKKGQVYLGEYASWGNKMKNAIAEAIYMIGLERNGDLVRMASYAPLFAKHNFTQWRTDLIFFDNRGYYLTPNYYVQQLFSVNRGDYYISDVISKDNRDSLLAASCVADSKTGDVVIKIANAGNEHKQIKIDFSGFYPLHTTATKTEMIADPGAGNSFEEPGKVKPSVSSIPIAKKNLYHVPANSITILRVIARQKVNK